MNLLITHMGMGDQIICCGMALELQRRHGPMAWAAMPFNVASVSAMLHGRMAVLGGEVFWPPHQTIHIGYSKRDLRLPFDQAFYKQAGVAFEKRWGCFDGVTVAPDAEPPKGDFIFVHDDWTRNFSIPARKLPAGDIVRPSPDRYASVWDWLPTMRAAKELHLIGSVFLFMADCFPDLAAKTVYHTYARPVPNNEWPTLKYVKERLA